MAKTFVIMGRTRPKAQSDPIIVTGRAVLGPNHEAIHSDDLNVRRILGITLFDNIQVAGTVLSTLLFGTMAPTSFVYGNQQPYLRNFASVVSNRTMVGSFTVGFMAMCQ